MTSHVYVLLPALNEAQALTTLIPAIGETLQMRGPFTIVLVDDGSTDATPALADRWKAAWPVQVLRHEKNKGYGAALRTGFEWVIRHAAPTDIAISLDADNTHRPDYIPQMIQKIEDGCDVVTTSYWTPGGAVQGVPFKRQVMSRVVNLLFRIVVPVKGVRMYTNGFRAYRVSALLAAKAKYGERLMEQTGFPGGAELFTKICRMNVKAAEVPFVLHYENRGGDSKIRLFATIRGYLRLLTQV